MVCITVIDYIVILIIIIVITGLILLSDKTENYDARISNITENECGSVCTEAPNCGAFGYKHGLFGGKCYLSQRHILARPIDSLYFDEYSKIDKRCNKINTKWQYKYIGMSIYPKKN